LWGAIKETSNKPDILEHSTRCPLPLEGNRHFRPLIAPTDGRGKMIEIGHGRDDQVDVITILAARAQFDSGMAVHVARQPAVIQAGGNPGKWVWRAIS